MPQMHRYLETGKIVTTHGLKGEVRIQPWSDTPADFCKFKRLFSADGSIKYNIVRSREAGNMVIAKIEGVDTIEAAKLLKDRILCVDRADIPLPEGTYFVADLLGIEVRDESGGKIGVVGDVFNTGANDVYEICSECGKKYYIPAIPSVVLHVDIEAGVMTIHPMEGLFD